MWRFSPARPPETSSTHSTFRTTCCPRVQTSPFSPPPSPSTTRSRTGRKSSPRPRPTSEYCNSARKGPRHPGRPRFHPRDACAAGAGARPRYCHPAAPDSLLARTRLDAPEQHLHRQLSNPVRGIFGTDHRAPWRTHRFLAVYAIVRNPPPQPLGVFPAPRQRLVYRPHGQDAQGRQLGNHRHRTFDHGGLRTMKTTHLEEKRTALVDRREKLIARFGKAARERKGTTRLEREIQRVNEFLESLDRIAAETTAKPEAGLRRYAVSSLFLHESFKKLTADRDEQFFFVTGSEIEGCWCSTSGPNLLTRNAA